LLADTPAIGVVGGHRGLDAVSAGSSRPLGVGPSSCRHGRQPDWTATATRKPVRVRGRRQHPTPADVSVCAARRATPSTHATSYWVGNPLEASVRRLRRHRLPGSAGTRSTPAIQRSVFVNVYRVVSNLGVFDFNGPDHQMRGGLAASGRRTPSRWAEKHLLRGARPWRGRT